MFVFKIRYVYTPGCLPIIIKGPAKSQTLNYNFLIQK